MDTNSEIEYLVLYDGECRFCNNSINFILKVERGNKLRFSALQSIYGQGVLKKFGLSQNYTDSLLFLSNGRLFDRSRAVFKIVPFLSYPWKLFSVLQYIPSKFIDPIYNLLAKHRFRILGKEDSCIIPSTALKNRFLE